MYTCPQCQNSFQNGELTGTNEIIIDCTACLGKSKLTISGELLEIIKKGFDILLG